MANLREVSRTSAFQTPAQQRRIAAASGEFGFAVVAVKIYLAIDTFLFFFCTHRQGRDQL